MAAAGAWAPLLTAAGGGCAAGEGQRYYLAAADLDEEGNDPKLTFYRVTVQGESINTRSTFQSGFYDADALHQLFGEVSKPDPAAKAGGTGGRPEDGGATVRAGTYLLRLDPATRQWQTVDDNQRFTFIYGANADAIAEQIRLFGESETTGQQMASLFAAAAAGDVFTDLERQRTRAQRDAKAAGDLAAEYERLAGTIEANAAKPGDVRGVLLKAAQAAAKAAGSAEQFDPADLDAAFTKAGEVRDRLAKRR